jgi:hypothetical protein
VRREARRVAQRSQVRSPTDAYAKPASSPSETLDLVLCWKTVLQNSGGKHVPVKGQHHVIGVSVCDLSRGGASAGDSRLRFSIQSPHSVTHDFLVDREVKNGKERSSAHKHAKHHHQQLPDGPTSHAHSHVGSSICSLPLLFHVSNTSQTEELAFDFETLRPNEELPLGVARAGSASLVPPHSPGSPRMPTSGGRGHSSDAGPAKRAQYFWGAHTKHAGLILQAGESRVIRSMVCFTRPGIYNINRYKFVVHTGGVPRVVLPTFQHVIRVEDAQEVVSDEALLGAGPMEEIEL